MERRDLLKAAAAGAATLPVILAAGTASAETLGPVLAVMTHPVKDYAAWRAVYNGAKALRQKAGVTGAEVFRDPVEPNLITVINRLPSVEAAHAYHNDPALKAAMDKAGVMAPPRIIIAVAA